MKALKEDAAYIKNMQNGSGGGGGGEYNNIGNGISSGSPQPHDKVNGHVSEEAEPTVINGDAVEKGEEDYDDEAIVTSIIQQLINTVIGQYPGLKKHAFVIKD